MKQFFLIICILLVGIHHSIAQGSATFESFNRDVLSHYGDYFNRAELTTGGQLQLTATGKYKGLTLLEKNNIMNGVVKSWQQSLILIRMDSKSELWERNNETGNARLMDSWDLNSPKNLKMPDSKIEGTSKHPWFFYLGGMSYIDSNKNFDVALNAHVGFFLLLNRWDLAASYSEIVKGTTTSNVYSGQLSLGMLSKVYFPIKELNISPNIGGQIDLNMISNNTPVTETTFTPSLLMGISWYVGIGSLDLGFKIGNGTTTMIGYTIIPGFGKVKKNK